MNFRIEKVRLKFGISSTVEILSHKNQRAETDENQLSRKLSRVKDVKKSNLVPYVLPGYLTVYTETLLYHQ